MLEKWRNSRVPSIEKALQKLKAKHGAGPRFAIWLLRTYGFENGQPLDLQVADLRIMKDFGVSGMTAFRWRTGSLPTIGVLEEMRQRWGLPFILFLFNDAADDTQRDLIWRLKELDDGLAGVSPRTVALVREREAVLVQLGAGKDSLFRSASALSPSPAAAAAASVFAALVQAEHRKSFAGRIRARLGRI